MLQGGEPPVLAKEGRWCEMSVFEAISLMVSFGIFVVTLLAYINSGRK
ncbi:hypothetical protein BRYFOR_06859 [Marvinbryantia formatexigens DSM 14469]|uniref:Holin-like toxin n=1 Tax=Marvinbryantia formatexigens DSM 14469 TaxID=478749 RepID=C6LE10_9FIRM|nr:hypothetical protein BRYFOR_06859 [Marvinbryantia formatexigens DSM 14469]